MKVIIDLQYFIQSTSLKKIDDGSNIFFDVFENNSKRSFFNRCVIAGANGPITLTVPLLKGRSQHTIVRDLEISNEEKWQLRHWRSIVSSYNASPWFIHYRDELAAFYDRPFRLLMDWNLACMHWVLAKLDLSPVIQLSTEAMVTDTLPSGTIDRRRSSVLKAPTFSDQDPIRYRQVFEDRNGFIPGLSIIDLLFCEGPKRSVQLLQQAVP